MPKRKEYNPEIKKILGEIEEYKKSIKELKQKIKSIENDGKNNFVEETEKGNKFKITFD